MHLSEYFYEIILVQPIIVDFCDILHCTAQKQEFIGNSILFGPPVCIWLGLQIYELSIGMHTNAYIHTQERYPSSQGLNYSHKLNCLPFSCLFLPPLWWTATITHILFLFARSHCLFHLSILSQGLFLALLSPASCAFSLD